MLSKAKILAKIFAVIFVVLFLGRLIVLNARESHWENPGAGRTSTLTNVMGLAMNQALQEDYEVSSFASSPRNFARYDMKKAKPAHAQAQLPQSAGTHYERVASMGFQTRKFEEDEKKLRELVAKYKAVVQSEHRTGLEGSRSLALSLGVTPENFDESVAELQKLSKLVNINIEKTDRTQEFKELAAKQTTLKKKRDALQALRNRPGKIPDFVELEDKILEIEREVQAAGVQISGFESGVDLCTVRVSLNEAGKKRPFIPLAMDAAEWAFWETLKLGAMIFVVVLLIGAIAGIWGKFDARMLAPSTGSGRGPAAAPEVGKKKR